MSSISDFDFEKCKDSEIIDTIIREYLVEKIKEICEAVTIREGSIFVGLCKYCGVTDLYNDYETRRNFLALHTPISWLASEKKKTEIEFLKCLSGRIKND